MLNRIRSIRRSRPRNQARSYSADADFHAELQQRDLTGDALNGSDFERQWHTRREQRRPQVQVVELKLSAGGDVAGGDVDVHEEAVERIDEPRLQPVLDGLAGAEDHAGGLSPSRG